MQTNDLKRTATDIRLTTLKMLHSAGSGHTGGALGIVDVLTALYFGTLNIDQHDPSMADRDRFVLSPAHMVPALYATLMERGMIPRSEVNDLRKFGSRLQGHTQRDLSIGVETTGGSLGQGVGVACGFALAAKLNEQSGRPGYKVYCMTSDGECQEGSVWEAAMFAAKFDLDNLVFIVDHNNMQLSGAVDQVMPIMNKHIKERWQSFGWYVLEMDGNDMQQVNYTLQKVQLVSGRPVVIVSHTTSGKGVSFIEGDPAWHGQVLDEDQYHSAVDELREYKRQLAI